MIKRFLTVFLLSLLVITAASIAAAATDTTEIEPTATPEAVEPTAEPTIEPSPEVTSTSTIELATELTIEPTATPEASIEDTAEPTATPTPETIIEYIYLETDDPAIWDKPFDDYTPAEGLLLLIFAGGFFAALVSVVFYKII